MIENNTLWKLINKLPKTINPLEESGGDMECFFMMHIIGENNRSNPEEIWEMGYFHDTNEGACSALHCFAHHSIKGKSPYNLAKELIKWCEEEGYMEKKTKKS